MRMHLEPAAIVWSCFGGLEPREDNWAGDKQFWEDFNAAFFASNGLEYDPRQHSNVDAWIEADDRAPYTDMVAALLPRLAERHDLGDIDMVILAHWLPDLHLGSSVTNYAMHFLGLQNARGFAVSDRGLTAPFFALDLISKCISNGKVRKALLLVMDQKHLLYKSTVLDALKPENAGLAMVLSSEGGSGLTFAGYARRQVADDDDITGHLQVMASEMGIDLPSSRIIADPRILGQLQTGLHCIAIDPTMVCAAPFCELERHADWNAPFLLMCLGEGSLSIVGFVPSEGAHAN